MYEEFKGQGLEVLLISFRESADLVKRTVTERGYTAPVLLDASGDLTGRVYGVFGPPTVYLVDREGRLVGRMIGGGDWSGAAAPPAWAKLGVQAYESPKPAPAFALPALDGRTVRLEDQKGKALLLFFWATW